jgi:hypothetical protein
MRRSRRRPHDPRPSIRAHRPPGLGRRLRPAGGNGQPQAAARQAGARRRPRIRSARATRFPHHPQARPPFFRFLFHEEGGRRGPWFSRALNLMGLLLVVIASSFSRT